MKKILLTLGCTLLVSTAAYATNCEEVKQLIAEKITANGVSVFTLEAIEKGTATDKKVVGVCGGGTKDIVYQRGNASETTTVVEQSEQIPVETATDSSAE